MDVETLHITDIHCTMKKHDTNIGPQNCGRPAFIIAYRGYDLKAFRDDSVATVFVPWSHIVSIFRLITFIMPAWTSDWYHQPLNF